VLEISAAVSLSHRAVLAEGRRVCQEWEREHGSEFPLAFMGLLSL